jgi:hypothetical protein
VLLAAQNPTLSGEQVDVIVSGVCVNVPTPAPAEAAPAAGEVDEAAAAGVVDMQATAFNGAQVAALLQVLSSVSSGVLGDAAAMAVIAAAFPTVTEAQAQQMVNGAKSPAPAMPVAPSNGVDAVAE